MGNVNLDDIFDEQPHPEMENLSGVTDLVVTPKAKASKAAEQTSALQVMDRYKTLLFCIDMSASTAEAIGSDKVGDYDWPEDLKEHLNRALRYSPEDELAVLLETADEVQIKEAVVAAGPARYGIYSNLTQSMSKMALMKKCVGDLVDRRLEKFPDARVVLETFNTDASIEASDPARIKQALQDMYPAGGTNIFQAVSVGIAYFEKYPSPVGLNHMIVVTDGEDWQAVECKTLVPRMKELGIVMDYIYIKAKIQTTASAVGEVFRNICADLNGEYAEVASASAFEKKFISAANRLCLPPGE